MEQKWPNGKTKINREDRSPHLLLILDHKFVIPITVHNREERWRNGIDPECYPRYGYWEALGALGVLGVKILI
jgi:hypothetical protein